MSPTQKRRETTASSNKKIGAKKYAIAQTSSIAERKNKAIRTVNVM